MLVWHPNFDLQQNALARSYIGGIPMLPKGVDLPRFAKTNTDMTFFFQIEIRTPGMWSGKIVSVFCSTDYLDDEMFIPKLPSPLARARLAREFFIDYQSFFRIFVFESNNAIKVEKYVEKIAFRELMFSDNLPDGAIQFGQISHSPNWILEDESPLTYEDNIDMFSFLFQTKLDYQFHTVSGAAKQKVIDYAAADRSLSDSDVPSYSLFTSNELFFFGVNTDEYFVYIVPQS